MSEINSFSASLLSLQITFFSKKILIFIELPNVSLSDSVSEDTIFCFGISIGSNFNPLGIILKIYGS